MKISDVIKHLESKAPLPLQESWDNSGLLTGDSSADCSGVLLALDMTEEVVAEAVRNGCNLIVAHHPVIFKGLKRLTGKTAVERTVIDAIRQNVALYAIHTNLDNTINGVSGRMGMKIGLKEIRVLQPMAGQLKKLYTYVPETHLEALRTALFDAGGGSIGRYDECSFGNLGEGTFRPLEGAEPFIGEHGKRQQQQEWKIEVLFESWKEAAILRAMRSAHPYEEIAFEIVKLENIHQETGSGIIGKLPVPVSETEFLTRLKEIFELKAVRHTPFTGRMVSTVAMCGGAGSFLINNALGACADVYVTADVKYHEFFGAEGRMVIADIGHFESEQFTVELLYEILLKKFPNFAVLKSDVITNPIQYF